MQSVSLTGVGCLWSCCASQHVWVCHKLDLSLVINLFTGHCSSNDCRPFMVLLLLVKAPTKV